MGTSLLRSDVGEQLISSVLSSEYSIDEQFNASSSFPQDVLGKRLDPYMLRLLTGRDLIPENPVLLTGTQYGLPSSVMADALITSFFHNFAPLYPIVDEVHFRALYQQYQHDQIFLDQRSRALIYIVLALGAATANDMIDQEQTASVRFIRESIFSQAMTLTSVLHGQENIQNVQILVLISFYFSAINSLSSSWFWCGCAIRLLKTYGQRRQGVLAGNEDQFLKNRLLCSVFILEKQLSVLQHRTDIMLTIEDVDVPGEIFQSKNSMLLLRFQLACLTHRFCALLQPACLNPVNLADNIDQLYIDVSSWCNSLQAGYQPGGDMHVESKERQFVLLMHLEYHGLLLGMFTTLETTGRLLPRYTNVKKHSSVRIRNHCTIRMNNARRLLHTVGGIVDSAQVLSQTLCWLNITQILPSFTMLYAQILKRPSLLSARSDAELLVITAQVIDHYLCGTPEKKTMSEIIQSMAAAASSAVTSSSTSSRGRTSDNVSNLSPASLSSRNTNQASTSPASLEENTPTSSDTPLSFYFNVAPNHQTHDPSASGLDSRPANVQGDLETSLFAMDAVTMPAAMDLPPNQSPTDPSLWFPPY